MEFQKVLEKRRSVRQYKKEKITRDEIIRMIEAAQMAPSWKNQQTSRYHCVTDPEKIVLFREMCLPEFNRKNSENVSALIVTTFVSEWSGYNRKTHQPENEVGNGWGFYDLGLQNENLILKAEEMGISTLIMGIRNSENIRKMLGIPEEEIIVSVIAAGKSDVEMDMPKRKNIEDIVRFY